MTVNSSAGRHTNGGLGFDESGQRKEILAHTSLRGLAALLVAFYHLEPTLKGNGSVDQWTMLFKNSFAFVDLFFVLSGFTISSAYATFFHRRPSAEDIRNFYVNRVARIYPLHLATMLYMAAMVLYIDRSGTALQHPDVWLENGLLLHGWGLSDRFILNFPSWSVSVEFLVYLLFPAICIWWRRKPAPLPLAIILFFIYAGMRESFDTLNLPERFAALRGLGGFGLGILVYHYRAVMGGVPDRFLSSLQLVLMGSLLFVLHADLDLYLLIPLFAGLVVSTADDRGLLAVVLRSRVLVQLGLISFSVYLLHIPVRNTLYFLTPKAGLRTDTTLGQWAFIAVAMTMTVVASVVCYRYYEMPARSRIKALSASRLFNRSQTG